MSRRREAREQEKEDFLDANPQLFRSETRIEVGRAEPDDHFGQNIIAFDVMEPVLPPYVAEVTVDGEPEWSFTVILDADPDQTLAEFVGFPGGELFAGFPFFPGDFDEVMSLNMEIPPYPMFGDVLSLTEDGFGVAQSGFGPMPYVMMYEPMPMMPSGNDAALDGDERIFLDVFVPKHGGELDFRMLEGEDDGPGFELGGKELGIDFKVVSGTGTVQVVLVDFDDDGNEIMFETAAGARRPSSRVEEGRIEAEMTGDSAFDAAYIAVTGDLEITVTGIDLSTNFEPFLNVT